MHQQLLKEKKIPTALNGTVGIAVVRLIGLEPTRRETLDPKSSASTNFATGAICGAKVVIF